MDSVRHRLCAGIDPSPDLPSLADAMASHEEALRATPIRVLKPNLGFFLAQGSQGIVALERFCAAFANTHEIIIDLKCNEIANSLKAYLSFVFDRLHATGLTLNPFLGEHTIQLAAEKAMASAGNRARIYVLCATSEFSTQGLAKLQNSEAIIDACAQIRDREKLPERCLGLVVGANRSDILQQKSLEQSRLSLLLPGLGAQGVQCKDVAALKVIPNECTFPLSRAFFEGGRLTAGEAQKAMTPWIQEFSKTFGGVE